MGAILGICAFFGLIALIILVLLGIGLSRENNTKASTPGIQRRR
jgi:hypothetical protein